MQNIIFELELLGGAGDICADEVPAAAAERTSGSAHAPWPGRLGLQLGGAVPARGGGIHKIKDVGYELCIKGELLLFLATLVGRTGDLPPADTPDTRRLKTVCSL